MNECETVWIWWLSGTLHIFISKLIKRFYRATVKPCFLSFTQNCLTVRYCHISRLNANYFCSFSSKPAPLLCVGQLVGRAMGKDSVNSLSVEGFVQTTLVTSPEVAHLLLLLFSDIVYYLYHL